MTRLLMIAALLATTMPLRGSEPEKQQPAEEPAAPQSPSTAQSPKSPSEECPIPRIVELKLDEHVVPARMINIPIPGKTKTVQDVLDRFEKWSKDDRVGAVMLEVSNIALSLPDVQELKQGIAGLKEGKKKVFAYLNGANPFGYLLACDADEVVIAPTGNVMLPGMGALFPFMKGYYQMMGLEFDVISAGRYKYPGFVNAREPNEFFKEEYNAILDGWIEDYYTILMDGRGMSRDAAKEIVDIALFDAQEAQQRGLVDTLAYIDDYRDQLARREKMRRQKTDEDGLARVNSLQDLFEVINETMQEAEEARRAVGPKIAVLNARGPIIDQNLGAGLASAVISRDDFAKTIEEIKENDSIKAVVMRIDSPGGSGYASDVIWRKLRELDEKKPLVVSMGRVAGSGGYYIACPARRIFAQPTTITGSIGVLGIMQCSQSALNRMDYEVSPMQRGERALLGSAHRELSKEDRQFIQEYIDDFYGVFIDRVAQTRKIPAAQVRKIAEGRIYTGRQAKEIGLVDELGGLDEAVASARELANIPASAEVRVVQYPRASSLGELLESFGSAGAVQMAGMNTGSAGGFSSPAERMMNILAGSMTAAPSMSFDQQLMLFSQQLQPLCWMAVPLASENPFASGVSFGMPAFQPNALLPQMRP